MSETNMQELRVDVTADSRSFSKEMDGIVKLIEATRKKIDDILARVPKAVPSPALKPQVTPVQPSATRPVATVPELNQTTQAAQTLNVEAARLPAILHAAADAARKPKEALQEILDRAKGVSDAAAGVAGTSSKEWQRYRSIALRELEAVQRKIAVVQKTQEKLTPQIFHRDLPVGDDYIQRMLQMGMSDAAIDRGLARKEQESAASKAGIAYAAAKAQMEQYSAAVTEAAQRLQQLNAQVDASRAAEDAARRQAAAAKELAKQQAAAAKEQAAMARRQAAEAKANASLATRGLGALIGLPRVSNMALMGVLAVVGAVKALGQSLFNAALQNDEFRNSVAQIKGNLAVAFQVIYQSVLPALQVLAAWLAHVTNLVARFLAMLFGINYDTAVAGAKKQEKAIKGVGGAARAATRALAGFDEANILSFQSRGGGGGGKVGFNIDDIELQFTAEDIVKKIKEWWAGLADWHKKVTVPALLAIAFSLTPLGVLSTIIPAALKHWRDELTPNQRTVIIDAILKIAFAVLFPALTVIARLISTAWKAWGRLTPEQRTQTIKGILSVGFTSILFNPLAGIVEAIRQAWTVWGAMTPDQRQLFTKAVLNVVLDILFAPLKTIISSIQQAWQAWRTGRIGMGGDPHITAGEIDATAAVRISLTMPAWSDILSGIKKGWNNIISGRTATVSMRAGVYASGALSGVTPVTWAAQGGILNSAQLIGAGEAGRELLLPLDRNTGWMDTLAARVAELGGGSGDIVLTVVLDGEPVYKNVVQRAEQERRRTGLSPLLV